MSRTSTSARYLIVVAAALAVRRLVNARRAQHHGLDGTSADHWATAVAEPPVPPAGASPPAPAPPAPGSPPPRA